jgi:prepilin-type N-terminal cleavage/methylation domain-containing protein
MKSHRSGGSATEGLPASRSPRSEDGFTLIELIVVTTILPLVIGAISVGLISVLSLQSGVSSRLGDSADSQTVAASFEADVQSASMITTSNASLNPANTQGLPGAPCGSSSQLFGLLAANGTEISYVEVPQGSGGSVRYDLFRYVCQGGSTTVLTSVVSYDLPASQPLPNITVCSACTGINFSNGWHSTATVTGVSLTIAEPGSKYTYNLVALPRASGPGAGSSVVAATPTTGCGFATAGTGTYAATLCFVDFTPYNPAAGTCTGGQGMSAAVANTPYSLTFCLTTSGGPVAPASFPTYFNPGPPINSAFLGNNGFYTGVPGKPALYQTVSGTTTTLTFTNVQLLDSNGNPATGWELVTGDAESTDTNESITWTSDQILTLLANSPTSQIGNACAEPTTANPLAIYLTGLGTKTVQCAETVSSAKTGTVMLEAITPTTLTVTLVGGGLQAMFLGVLLP